MSDVKKMINGLINDAARGIEELEGKDKVMAQIGLADALCNFLQVPGVLTGEFDSLLGSKSKGKKTKKPAPPATEEEAKEPPKAKVIETSTPAVDETVDEAASAPAEAEPQKNAAPAVEDTPSFETWDEEAQAYYAAGLDELYDMVSDLDDPEGAIDALMSEFSKGLVKTFMESSPNAFNAFLVYVKECAAAADNEAVAG